MKIAHYASLSSLVLLLVAGVQAAALFHGWQQFNRAEQAQRQQERLQQQLSGPLQGALRDYLGSGDPLRLAEAQGVRQQALSLLAQQDGSQTSPLRALLEQMGARIEGDYLAAGKLSGNSQWLLQNAENELSTQARALLRYGQQGADLDPASAEAYRQGAADILATLPALAHQRQNYMEQASAKRLEGLLFELAALQKQADALTALPSLNLFEETAADEFTLGEPVRKELGIRTIFNILGPLTNPAGAANQLLGVFHPDLVGIQVRVLQRLGSRHVLVVHGKDGMDEVSLGAATMVGELKDGEVREYEIHPEDFGLRMMSNRGLKVEDAASSKEMLLEALDGVEGTPRDIVVLNAGTALYAGNHAASIKEGIERARESVASGAAKRKLDAFVALTRRLAGTP